MVTGQAQGLLYHVLRLMPKIRTTTLLALLYRALSFLNIRMSLRWFSATTKCVVGRLRGLLKLKLARSFPANHVPEIVRQASEEQMERLHDTPSLTMALTGPFPSLFAVIIGIDRYNDPDITDLSGAAADADAVQEFLVSKLGAAVDRIVSLRNEEATRSAIIEAIRNLADNPRITADDPILVYYAGHGSQAKSPLVRWETSSKNNMIQMLVPHDFVYKGSKDQGGQGVFDLTLSNILADIAQKKSDNITIILDSCHSGSGTRNLVGDERITFRGVQLPSDYGIPSSILSQDIVGDRGSHIPHQLQKGGLSSHVLLAACMQGETAAEINGRGVFTTALLGLLQKEGIDQLTYEDIIMRLPALSQQNPQCEGVSQKRILFTFKTASHERKCYTIRSSATKAGEYILTAGDAHGVNEMAKFDVYTDSKMKSPPIGTVVAGKVEAFATRCYPLGVKPFLLQSPAYAFQTHNGVGHSIQIFVDAADRNRELFINRLEEMKTNYLRSYYLSPGVADKPDLTIKTHDSHIQIGIMDELCCENGLTSMPFDNVMIDEPTFFVSVLCSAADFYRNFHHSRRVGLTTLSEMIQVECLKVVPSGEYTDDLYEILVPDSQGHNFNVNGKIHVNVDENAEYGFRIVNSLSQPLYAALFYFDMSDLSIVSYYLPGTAKDGHADFSIPAHGSLSIGFGDTGTLPRIYKLRPNQSVDVGYLKLYLSTQFVDYSNIAQLSPFSAHRGYRTLAPRPLNKDSWDTMTIPIIQRKSVAAGPPM